MYVQAEAKLNYKDYVVSCVFSYVCATQCEKQSIMCAKYTHAHYSTYLTFYIG